MKIYSLLQLIGVFIISLYFITGCSNIPTEYADYITPKVSVENIRVAEMGLMEQTLEVRLKVDNPNPFQLPIEKLVYNLSLNDKPFAEGESDKAVNIPAEGNDTVTLQMKTKLTDILSQWQSALDRKFQYHIKGNLYFLSWLPQMPFDKQGEVTLNFSGEEQPAQEQPSESQQ